MKTHFNVNSLRKQHKKYRNLWSSFQKIGMKNKPGYQPLLLQFVSADYQIQGPNFLLCDTAMNHLNISNKKVNNLKIESKKHLK